MNQSKQVFIKAIQNGEIEKVRNLSKKSPDLVNEKTEEGISVLLLAMYYRKDDIVNVLLSHKTKFDLFEAAAAGRLDFFIKKIETEKEEVNQFSVDGFTPLGLACFFGKKEMVKYALEKNANPNLSSRNDFKVAPLHSAVAANEIEIVKLLLKNGANVNAQQMNGVTALHSAAHIGSLEIVKLLLKNGAEKNAKTSEGKTPLAFAEENGFLKIVKILKE